MATHYGHLSTTPKNAMLATNSAIETWHKRYFSFYKISLKKEFKVIGRSQPQPFISE